MGRINVKGTRQLGLSLSASVVDQFKDFCESRGETMRYHVELALERHMNNPPPKTEPPPLPPVPPPEPPRLTGRKKKRRKGK